MMPGENKAVLITRRTASTEPSAVVRNPRGNLIGSLATLLEPQSSEGSRATVLQSAWMTLPRGELLMLQKYRGAMQLDEHQTYFPNLIVRQDIALNDFRSYLGRLRLRITEGAG